jgi:hypothetical protein
MQIKLAHPLWTNLPSLAALVALIVGIIISSPLPGRAPVNFSAGGAPNAYGSPWLAFGLTIGISVLFIILSIFLDEAWARQEKAKIFNWFSLMDDIVVGAMVGISLGYLAFLRHDDTSFSFPWQYLGMAGGAATMLAILLELARPYRHYQEKVVEREKEPVNPEIIQRIKEDSTFFYWDYQNPFYFTLFTIIVPLVMLVGAILSWLSQPWVSVLLIIAGILIATFYGGQRISVTRQNITVRCGIIGIRVLRLNTAEITAVEAHDFSPLKDFSGYGIRANREMSGYFLGGTRGVKLTTANNKKYLIGSDNPDRLAAVISAISANPKG